MLVVDLGKWMNKILIDWGIDPKVADRFDETIPRITDQQKGLMSFQRECVRPCSANLFMLSVSKKSF